jgi:hypothetical protein
MAWHTPHRGEHGWVLNAAGDDLLVDHAVAIGLAVWIDERGVGPSVTVT